MSVATNVAEVEPARIRRNPSNPRRFFNDESLDILRTSIQEIGVLVPLIAYQDPKDQDSYVLMDGERRWSSALDLGLPVVPVNVIAAPTPLENLLRMFNIHSVRDEWPLISIALSLRDVIRLSGEDREARLAEITGLPRATVRRAKRLLTLPERELELIQSEAHLDRTAQVHREDLYLEVEQATSVIRNAFPEIAKTYTPAKIIREFVRKRELGNLTSVTDYRFVGRLIKSIEDDGVSRERVHDALVELIVRADKTPQAVYDEVAKGAYEELTVSRRVELLLRDLVGLEDREPGAAFVANLKALREEIDRILSRLDA